jgi:light-regulated signal transduction histidine kinase (bacteriophytochrome)
MPHPYWPPEEQATIMTAAQTLANGQELDDVELIFMRKNGQRFPVIVTPTILYDEQGTITNYMALIKDISHIKLVQEELRRSRDELELRVQQRTMELADVNAYLQTQIMERENLTQQLLHSNQELEQFAYIASHDLQEPLRAITSYTQLLAQRYEEQLDERADKYIHYIVDGASYMQQLIQDLLSYSRVGRGELTLEQLDLNQVLQQVEKNLDAAIAEAEARLHYDPLPTITADLNQLTRLLQNLVSNAIKYRSDRSPEITITVEDLGDHWLFTLQDNGIGIDPQYADRIFIIFQRLHTRRQYSGTGIGLAICKKIVERHHGTIGVQSQPGQGSTFRFTIAKALTQQAFLEG